MAIAYRKEVDGLRAVAVLPVILFHAGVSAFGGGFVGVDVFFVISGFLITSILLEENSSGRYSIIRFYERRARRILPALFFVMAVSLICAWFVLLPKEMSEFSISLAAVAGFVSNFLFWSSSGYFDSASELKPMLHTWSLAVEEQYYIFFPIILAFMWKKARSSIGLIMVLASVASLIAAQSLISDRHGDAFYLIHARCWELLVGSISALACFKYNVSSIPYYAREILSSFGFILICYAVFAFNSKTPFPGVYASIPVIGCALILVFSDTNTIVGRILSNKLFVSVGLISYSLYLWHQPVFAFARIRYAGDLSVGIMLLLSLFSMILAYFTWKYVESPFRNRSAVSSKSILGFAVAGSLVFLSVGYIGNKTDGFAGRLTKEQAYLLSFESKDLSKINRLKTCFLDGGQDPSEFKKECFASAEGGVVVWGDSHAAALYHGISKVFGKATQLTAGSCPPLMGVTIEWRPKCKSVNDYAIDRIISIRPDVLIFDANWDIYHWQKPETEIVNTIKYIRERSPKTKFVVVGLVPKWSDALPKIMYRNGVYLDGEHFMKGSLIDAVSKWDDKISGAAIRAGAIYFSPYKSWCAHGACKVSVVVDGETYPTAWDYGHLTTGASIALARELAKSLPEDINGSLSDKSL